MPEETQEPVAAEQPSSFEQARKRFEQVEEMLRSGFLIEGQDYGTVQGINKPILMKPGAEKLCASFDLAPIIRDISRVEDWENGFFNYEYILQINHKIKGYTEAEGIGSCNSRERRYRNQDGANIANTILKMAKKRALIDGTLNALGISGLFTQDLDDMELTSDELSSTPRPGRTAPPQQSGSKPRYEQKKCPKCDSGMWDNSDPSTKKNPKAPDWKCKNKDCNHAIWDNNNITDAQYSSLKEAAKEMYGDDYMDHLKAMASHRFDCEPEKLTAAQGKEIFQALKEALRNAGQDEESGDDE